MSRNAAQSVGRVEALLSKIAKRVEKFDYDAAYKLCKKAYKEDPRNVHVLEQLSSVACELDRPEVAKKYYEKLIAIAPDHSHVAYFELAQFAEGVESLSFYERGINVIRSKISALGSGADTAEQRTALARSLSEAFCSIAELFFTDLCDEPNAEEKCRQAIDQAILVDSTNADAHRLLSEFHLTKQHLEEARDAMKICLEKWHPRYVTKGKSSNVTAVMDDDGERGEKNEESCGSDVPYAVRIECVKSLIELSMLEEADEALLSLLNEDDECSVAWYLLGTTGYIEWQEATSKATDTDAATTSNVNADGEELRKTSIRNLRKALRFAKRGELNDDALRAISGMLSEMCTDQNAAMDTDGNESSQDEEEMPVTEGDWETVSGSDDDVEDD